MYFFKELINKLYPEIYVNSAKKNFLAICDTFLLLSNSLSIRSEIHSKIISIFSKMVVYEWSRLHYNQDQPSKN